MFVSVGYGVQDHWMKFKIIGENQIENIGIVNVWNRGVCRSRIVGAYVELIQNENVCWTKTFKTSETNYTFTVGKIMTNFL